ncbi:MAG: hypothetical protein ABEJ46_01790, partial [Gemmatimonadota bacterium]
MAETELHLAVEVMSEQLTINGLLRRFEALERELFAELLDAAQQQHLRAVRQGEAPEIECPRCGSEYWVKRGSRHRQLTTSQGELTFPLRQVTCSHCDRTWSPFVERLGLEPRQRASEELREKLVGLVTEVSYRKASRFGEEQFGATLSAMEIWRTVQRRAREISFTANGDGPARLEVDGTQAPAGPDAHGEAVNLAFQVGDRKRENGRWRRSKRLVGLGMSDWSRALPEVLSPDLVVNDGGGDVCRAVAATYTEARFQRCEWHLVYGLDKALWNDGVEYKIRGRLQRELHERVFGGGEGRDRRADIRAWAADRLGTYERARSLVTSAVGEVCYEPPSSLRTTSHAEREMRELNRRTDVGA